jgi:hypothetical protein
MVMFDANTHEELLEAIKQLRHHENRLGKIIIGGEKSDIGLPSLMESLRCAVDRVEHAARVAVHPSARPQRIQVGMLVRGEK